MKYSYQSEKFAAARSALMLPHTKGEATSVAEAFFQCSLGLEHIADEGLDDDARAWLQQLSAFMDTSSIQDLRNRGAYLVKAEQFTIDELLQISILIDELATWFDHSDR
ncbi:hypothetical protein [Herbaspirillum seropedicae]